MKCAAFLLVTTILVAGCARNPPLEEFYSLPRAHLDITVARTVACNKSDVPYNASTVTTKVAYEPDPKQRYSVKIKALDGPLSNAEVTLSRTSDGILTGVNTSQAGQASQIIDAALAVAGLLVGAAGGGGDPAVKTACQYIRDNTEKGVLTVTFFTSEPFDDIPLGVTPPPSGYVTSREIKPIDEDVARFNSVRVLTRALCYSTSLVAGSDEPPVAAPQGYKGAVDLQLRQPAQVKVEVRRGADATCSAPDTVLWSGLAAIPQRGRLYTLPILSAPLFGKQAFALSLSDAGAITSLKYGYESGGADAIGTAQKGLGALGIKSPADRAADVKAEGDLIAQQERLVLCKADPKNCK